MNMHREHSRLVSPAEHSCFLAFLLAFVEVWIVRSLHGEVHYQRPMNFPVVYSTLAEVWPDDF